MRKVFWGLFFILSATFVIVNQLGYFTSLGLWTVLFTIFIIPVFVTSLLKLNYFGILFSLAFTGIVYSEPLNLSSVTPWPLLLAALLGSIGLSIMFGKKPNWKKKINPADQVINETDDKRVDVVVNFGSVIKYVNSENFEVANLSCSFGEMKVYFDDAKVKENAVINLDISFAGVELFIPKDWKIVNNVNVSLAAVDQQNSPSSKPTKTVTLQGKVHLAGVEITYV